MHRFLYAEPLTPGAEAKLSKEESHHLARVLRLQTGNTILLIDGAGTVASAQLLDASPKGAVAKVLSIEASEARSLVHLCFAIPKANALEFTIRRVGELGIGSFQPLVTQHSLPAKHFNHERWTKVVAEVSKQCEAAFFPIVHEPLSLSEWISKRNPEYGLVLCDEVSRKESFSTEGGKPGWYVLVGAEGGWSQEERARFTASGSLKLGLGSTRLRAETASFAATLLMKERLGELCL